MNAAARSSRIEGRLRDGIAAQSAGRLDVAEACYRAVLRDRPGLPDALHLLGQSLHLQRRDDEALANLDRAVAAAPGVAMYRTTRGIVLRALGQTAAAVAAFRDALRLDPAYLGAHRNLAAVLAASGDAEAARAAFVAALALAPRDAELWLGLARVLLTLDRPGEAAAAAERAAGLAPRSLPAVETWLAAADAAAALATLRARLEQLRAADPESIAVHLALVETLARLDEPIAALTLAETAARRWPGHGLAWRRLAARRAERGEHALAREAFARALALDGDDEGLRIAIANCHHREGDAARALALYREVVARNPRSKEGWYNAGTVLSVLGREAEALADYDRALAIDPEYAAAHANRAQGLLRLGRYAAAWAAHRWRDGRGALFPTGPWPPVLDGARIHVQAEQGIGDHLFFLRFVPLLCARGAVATVEAERRIEPMVARAGLAPVDAAPAGALVRRMGDLPYLLGLGDGDSVVAPLRLPVLADRAMRVQAVLSGLPRPWVGVTWHAGGAKGKRETFKTVPVERLGTALRAVAGTLVSVQRAPAAGEQARLEGALGRGVVDLSAWNEDLELMLALMAALDGYVGVSNANVHLRCGAGLGSDVLVPFPMDWRWRALSDGTVPWYPGSRAYHQGSDGDWAGAFAALAASLARRWS